MVEQFKSEWIKKVDEDILWICQVPRSGGTLLLRLLDSHPEIHCYPTVFGFENEERIWPQKDEFMEAKENILDNVFSNMNLEKFHFKGIRKQSSNMPQELYPIYFDGGWYKSIYQMFLSGQKPRDHFNAFFTALFNAWRNYQNLYGDKKYIVGHMTLWLPHLYTKNFRNFIADYHEGKMIFMIRDPKDWLASALALKKHSHFSSDPKEIMKEYKTYLEHANNLADNDSFIIFQFEDLVNKPRKTMTELVKHLNLKFNERLLFPSFNGAPFYQNSSFNLERKAVIDPGVLGKGSSLSPRAIKAIDAEFYDLYNSVKASRTF